MAGLTSSGDGTGAAAPVRVLLVDDNATDAMVATGLLANDADTDFRVEQAVSLGAALDRLLRASFDAVLLDLTLGDSEGLGTYLAVRNRAPGVPVVVVTGHDDEDLGRAAVEAGAQDFLTKGSIEGRRMARSLRFAIERQRRSQGAALRDPLTGLPGRGLLADRLREALLRAGADHRYVAVVWVGLGGLEGLVDQWGAGAADEVLAQSAQRLRDTLRPTDTLARVGAEEFAILAEGLARPANAERAGRRVLGDLALLFSVGDAKVRVAASVGVAHGRVADDSVALLDGARAAMLAVRASEGQGLRLARPAG